MKPSSVHGVEFSAQEVAGAREPTMPAIVKNHATRHSPPCLLPGALQAKGGPLYRILRARQVEGVLHAGGIAALIRGPVKGQHDRIA